MLIYADSSAVLAWLLEERGHGEVTSTLARSPLVCCSVLTLLESHRVVDRGAALGRIDPVVADRCRGMLDRSAAIWLMAEITSEVVAGARRTYPREPVRALDAIHLSTARFFRERHPGLAIVTLDRRLAENATLLGFEVLPRPR